MKIFEVPRSKIRVLLRTRGEHRPPHVHVENKEVPWEAKIRFSFVEDDDLEVMEVDPEENEPNAATIRRVLSAIHSELPLVRRRWWETFGTVCLEGKWARPLSSATGNQPRFEVLRGHQSRAVRVQTATFLPEEGSLRVTLRNGTTFSAPVGSGRDLSDKD